MLNLTPTHIKWITTGILATGIALGGFFPGYYYYQSKMQTNFVTVKGLAEMDVRADLGIWDIRFVVTGNSLKTAQATMQTQQKEIVSFLTNIGFKKKEILLKRTDTSDLMANPYRDGTVVSRYILNQNIQVVSGNVNLIEKAINSTDQLIAKGIVFENAQYSTPVSYIYTKINSIKPKMLQQATQNAQAAAEEFAKSSNTKVGKIHTANQGVFSILPREQSANAVESNQINKKVRVVSTIEYFLD